MITKVWLERLPDTVDGDAYWRLMFSQVAIDPHGKRQAQGGFLGAIVRQRSGGFGVSRKVVELNVEELGFAVDFLPQADLDQAVKWILAGPLSPLKHERRDKHEWTFLWNILERVELGEFRLPRGNSRHARKVRRGFKAIQVLGMVKWEVEYALSVGPPSLGGGMFMRRQTRGQWVLTPRGKKALLEAL